MSTADKIEVELLEELCDGFRAETPSNSSIAFTPLVNIRIGVAPNKLGEETFLWNFCRPLDVFDQIKAAKAWCDTAVNAENLLLDDRRDWEPLENLQELLPQLTTSIALSALGLESVIDGREAALVIAAEHEHTVWVLDLIAEEQAADLNALVSAVHVVSQEQESCLGWILGGVKKAEQIMELAVDVANNCEGRSDLKECRLGFKEALNTDAEFFNLFHLEICSLPEWGILESKQALDDVVDVYFHVGVFARKWKWFRRLVGGLS